MQIHLLYVICQLRLFAFAEYQPLPDELFDHVNFLALIVLLHVQPIAEDGIGHDLTQKERLQNGFVL